MAALTKFTLSPSGKLVYRSTGRLAPEGYTYRKNTVYGPDGRRIGSFARKIDRKTASKIAKAEINRTRRGQTKPKAPRPPKKDAKITRSRGSQFLETSDSWEDAKFYNNDFWSWEDAEAIKEEFAARVKAAALSVAPDWLQKRIRAFSTEAIWQAYQEDAFVFEKYFEYHSPAEAPHKSNISMWLYQFVQRVENFMGTGAPIGADPL